MAGLKKLHFLLLFIFVVPSSTMASLYKVEDNIINNFEIPGFYNESIAICFWDQRIQVVEKKRPAAWLGFVRGGYGNAFGVVLESGNAFYALLNNRALLAFDKKNIQAKIADVSPFDDEQTAKKALMNTQCKKLLLIKLKDFKIDGYGNGYSFYVDVEITVMNAKGETLTNSTFIDKFELGKVTKYKNLLPDAIRKGFYNALNKSEIIDAVNKESKNTEPAKPKSTEAPTQGQAKDEANNAIQFDIIVTKLGEEIEATVEEIGEKTIKYKTKKQPNGPYRIINIGDVFMIKYKDGTKEVMKQN